jgi:Na+/H+ antiporter NhaD/arsenite permease-like protein
MMIVALLVTRARMATVCPLAALTVLIVLGFKAPEIVAHAAPNIATVFVVMTTTQLAIRGILNGGAGEHITVVVAKLAAHRWLRRVPASVLLPGLFVPGAMLLAMVAHNIPAILMLTPLALTLSERYGVKPAVTLSAMLIASNLGGASMAWGDTPAIIQREQWGFSPALFASAMLPRNLAILTLLTGVACLVTWFPKRRLKTDWSDTLERLKARDYVINSGRFGAMDRREFVLGVTALVVFIGAQFAFPRHSLVVGAAVLAAQILFTPDEQRLAAYTTLGLDAIIVICSLFVIAGAVETTPLVHYLAEHLKDHQANGAIEITAYFLTSGISADGAAATLAPLVHNLSGGSMLSAWQLACGICAGSSTLLIAASAGPIINSVSRNSGHELTFRDYMRFGLPFSLLMMVFYLAFNMLAAR